MKRLIPLLLLLATNPVSADLTHSISKSTSLTVNAAATQVKRIGSSFSISGSGVDTTDGTTVNTVSVGTVASGIYSPGTIAVTQDVPGAAFSFSQNYTQGDAIETSAPSVGAVSNFSDITSTAVGVAGSLAGTITDSAITITAGGGGTVAVGQIINEIEID